jgi:hypothetical protein
MVKPSDIARSSLDVTVGEMVEGLYGWNEYCTQHGQAVLNVYPDRHHYHISVFEVVHSWRDMKCYACSKLLWKREQADIPVVKRADAPVTTLPAIEATTKEPA